MKIFKFLSKIRDEYKRCYCGKNYLQLTRSHKIARNRPRYIPMIRYVEISKSHNERENFYFERFMCIEQLKISINKIFLRVKML